MNSVQILGNLARDPEVRFTKTGRAVATFTVAASDEYVTHPQGKLNNRQLIFSAWHGAKKESWPGIYEKVIKYLLRVD